MSTTNEKYREDLTAYLLEVATGNGYPEYCLACAGYLGMAVAHLWDKDWPKYKDAPYRFFQSERGFDDMDDYITGNILKESKYSVAAIWLNRLGYKFEKVLV